MIMTRAVAASIQAVSPLSIDPVLRAPRPPLPSVVGARMGGGPRPFDRRAGPEKDAIR
jgi:hypothetical protein